MSGARLRPSPESVFQALRDLDAPPRREGDDAEHARVELIARAIRRRPVLGRGRRSALLAVAGIAAAFALGTTAVWAWSTLVAPPPELRKVTAGAAQARPPSATAVLGRARGTVVVTRDGSPFVVTDGRTHDLVEGSSITTAVDSRASLELSGGVLVDIAESTRVSLAAAQASESLFVLSAGRVALEVPQLARGQRVVVETPDTRVVVRGTKFAVDVRPAGGDTTVTSVEVSRGSVLVIGGGEETLVSEGQKWSSAREPELIDDLELALPEVKTDRSRAQPGRGPAPETTETLTEENRLFQQALDARNAGDGRRALRLFSDLLMRFPNSPMAHEARVERFRTLKQLGDPAGAAGEARRYLREHPDGSMAQEARDLIEAGADR